MTALNEKELRWDYSRNRRLHSVSDGECYGRYCHELLEIKCCSNHYQRIDPKAGYDLFHKGKLKAHALTVKELKERARALFSTSK